MHRISQKVLESIVEGIGRDMIYQLFIEASRELEEHLEFDKQNHIDIETVKIKVDCYILPIVRKYYEEYFPNHVIWLAINNVYRPFINKKWKKVETMPKVTLGMIIDEMIKAST